MEFGTPRQKVARFGLYEADVRQRVLTKGGLKIRLQDQPFQVLALLLERPGELVTREEIQQKLWPADTYVAFDDGLNTAVKKLRLALSDTADNPRFIETVPRRGYRFLAPVSVARLEGASLVDQEIGIPVAEESHESIASGVAVSDATPLGLPSKDVAPAAPPGTRKRRLRWIAPVAGGVIAAIVIALLLWQSRHTTVSRDNSTSAKAIAVLPFQNAGSDKDSDFLRLALPDEIATTLSYVPSFSIRPFATTSKYNAPNLDLQQAGREMGVTSIVTGHYLTEGNQLEVTLEAVDVANNRSVWRDSVSVAGSDKIAMREQITSRIRQRLVPVLGGLSAGQQGTRPESEEAYELYLRSVGVPNDVSPNKAAITMLERAVGIDSSYAPAWEALGIRYYYEADYGEGGPPMRKRSDSTLERALALDPNLLDAAVQLTNNLTERGELRNAYAEVSGLIKRRPDSANAHFALAYVLRYAGLLEQSAHECDTALALDPRNYRFRSCSLVFMQQGRPQRAMEFVRLDAGSEFAARQTALILLGQDKIDEARQAIQRASDAPQIGGPLLQVCLDPQQASQLDRTSQMTEAASVAEGDVEGWYIAGTMLSYCGQKDAAVRLLRRAVGQNYCAYDALQTDPLLAKLRRSPEFSGLLSAAKECQNTFLGQRDPH